MPFSNLDVKVESAKHLAVSMGDRIMLDTGNSKESHTCLVVGEIKPDTLIIQLPSTPGVADLFVQGTAIRARYFSKGALFGFKSHIIHAQRRPAELIFIETPFRVEKIDLRRHRRVDCFIACKIHGAMGIIPAHLLDISVSGSKLCVAREYKALNSPALQEPVLVECRVNEGRGTLHLGATVTNEEETDRETHYGLHFQPLAQEAESQILEYISRIDNHVKAL